MTWELALQMVGWTLVHTYGALFILGMLAAVCMHVWLLAFVVAWSWRRLAHEAFLPLGAWAQFVVPGCATALFYIPYGLGQFVTVELAGPGQNAAGQLTDAASQNQQYLVRHFSTTALL
jgi:hypothetical protein